MVRIRFEKDLPEMECGMPIWLRGGVFDGAVVFVSTDMAPVVIQLDGATYRISAEQWELTGDCIAYLTTQE